MEKTITITLTPEGNLELPPEIREQFSNGEQYSVVTTEDTITFKKVPKFDWEEWEKRKFFVNTIALSSPIPKAIAPKNSDR